MKYTGIKAAEMFATIFETTPEKLMKLFIENQNETWINNAYLDIKTPTYLQDDLKDDYYNVFSLGIYMNKVLDLSDPNKKEVEWEDKSYEFVPNFQIDYGDWHPFMNNGDCFLVFDSDLLATLLSEMIKCEEPYKTLGKCFTIETQKSSHSLSFKEMKTAVDTFCKNKDNENSIKEFINNILGKTE